MAKNKIKKSMLATLLPIGSLAKRGQLQGAIASLMGIAGLIGPVLFTETFALFIGPGADWHIPGAPFLLASLLLLRAAGLAWRATARSRASFVAREA